MIINIRGHHFVINMNSLGEFIALTFILTWTWAMLNKMKYGLKADGMMHMGETVESCKTCYTY